jgi:hypothetical protein
MKRQLNPIEKFKPIWEGGKSVEQYNIKVGFKIRMFCVSELNSLRQKNPAAFGPKETEELTKMIMDLKQDKGTISQEDQTCQLEDYQQFLSEFFQKVDYEDRHGTVTIKTSSKFRVMAGFIDVLAAWGPIDPEMLKCKKYCQFKAVDIFKALKKGEVPKRGGPKEQENTGGDAGLGNEVEELSKNMDNTNLGGNNNPFPGSNPQQDMSYHSGGNTGFPNNNQMPSPNNQQQQFTSYHSGGNNPYGGQQQNFNQGGNPYGGNMNNINNQPNNNGFSNPFGNNNFNNNNNHPQQQQQHHQHQQQIHSQRNNNFPPQNQNQYGKNQSYNPNQGGGAGMNRARKSKVFPSADRNPQKRLFKGKYELNAVIPIKYNTVDYFMLVENVRINNENALRELKRGKAGDILNTVLDSLEFLSYIHK